MDAIAQLVWDSQISVAVLGRGNDFILIPLNETGVPMSETLLATARDRDFVFAGVFGFINGEAKCKSESLDALPTMCAAIPAFVEFLRERLAPKSDAVDWLTKLHALEDPRAN